MKPRSAASTSESEENQDAIESTDTEDDKMSTTNYSDAEMHVWCTDIYQTTAYGSMPYVCLSICHCLVDMQCNVCQLCMNFELMCVCVYVIYDVSCMKYEAVI